MDSSRSLTVIIVDDKPNICKAIGEFIEPIEGLKVVGTATSIKEALDCITNLEPDVVIQDINMPSFGLMQSGIDVLRWTKKHYPATKVIMLSIHLDAIYKRTCLAFGAYAYVEKSTGTEVLTSILEQLVVEQAKTPKS